MAQDDVDPSLGVQKSEVVEESIILRDTSPLL